MKKNALRGETTILVAMSLLLLSAAPASAATVRNEIDLQITKTSSSAQVDVGGAFSYTLAVVNNGPSAAPNVEVTDALPGEVAFVGVATTQGSCSHDGSAAGGVVTCDLDSMLPNAPVTITIDVQLVTRPTGSDCFNNTGVATDVTGVIVVGDDELSWLETNLDNNSSTTEVCTSPLLGSIGDRVWHDRNADGVQDGDEPGITGVTATLSGAGNGTSDTAADGFYPVFGNLAAGSYTVTAACPAGFFATTPGSVDVALAAGQNFVDADFGCSNIDLALTKSVSQPEVDVGAQVTFTITVTNEGLAGATGVTVSDALPSGLTYVSDNGNASFDPGTLTWTIGSLAAGASTSLDFVVTVDEVGTFTNVAQVATANEPDVDSTPGNNVPAEDDQDDASVAATAVAATCTLGNFVWLDSDRDGKQDSGEKGIANVRVDLTNTGTNATASTTTDANGLYLFANLDAGTYRVDDATSTVGMSLGLTTVGTFTVSLDGVPVCEFLDADFGFAEVLPITGMNAADIGLWALALLLLGSLTVVGSRRMTSARVRSEFRSGRRG